MKEKMVLNELQSRSYIILINAGKSDARMMLYLSIYVEEPRNTGQDKNTIH